MQTRIPLIVTATVDDNDLSRFNALRKRHFPPDRNFLGAHITMFHRLPGEYMDEIVAALEMACRDMPAFDATVSRLRHLGNGVAFDIESPELIVMRDLLSRKFASWLGPQDKQKWRPHITVQNKVTKTAADRLHAELSQDFRPHSIRITGVDLWRYLNGPWQHKRYVGFEQPDSYRAITRELE